MPATDHFERRAHGYARRSNQGLWKLLRAVESREVRRLCPPLSGLRVLEACAGAGYYTRWLAYQGPAEMVAFDLSPGMISQATVPGVRTCVADLAHWQESNFDVVLCLGGLEFLPDLATFWRFARRCAKPQARLLLLFPQAGLWSLVYRTYYRWLGVRLLDFDLGRLVETGLAHGWQLQKHRKAGFSAEVARFFRS